MWRLCACGRHGITGTADVCWVCQRDRSSSAVLCACGRVSYKGPECSRCRSRARLPREFPISERTQRVIELASTHPYLTQVEVAQMVGVSRQRISEICKRHNLSFGPPKPTCRECGLPVGQAGRRHLECYKKSLRDTYECVVCGSSFVVKRSLSRQKTPQRGYSADYKPQFCSRSCWCSRYPLSLQCSFCGRDFSASPSLRYYARSAKTAKVSCPDCRQEARRQHAAAIRAKRWAKVAV